MFRRTLTVASAFSLALLTPGPALAEDGPAFNLLWYSDSSHTTQVGFARAVCYPGPQAQLVWGYNTQYEEVVWVGQCINGEHWPD